MQKVQEHNSSHHHKTCLVIIPMMAMMAMMAISQSVNLCYTLIQDNQTVVYSFISSSIPLINPQSKWRSKLLHHLLYFSVSQSSHLLPTSSTLTIVNTLFRRCFKSTRSYFNFLLNWYSWSWLLCHKRCQNKEQEQASSSWREKELQTWEDGRTTTLPLPFCY
jgi:hypothetical protein